MIRSELVKIIKRWKELHNIYCDSETGEEISIEDDIVDMFLGKGIVQYKIEITEAFDNPSYTVFVLAVSWIENGILQMKTDIIERM